MRRVFTLLALIIYISVIMCEMTYIDHNEQSDEAPVIQSSYNERDERDKQDGIYVTQHIQEDVLVYIPQIDDVEQWWTDYDLDILAAVIHHEAGSNECTDRHQQLVGQVVVNRMNSDEFPDTIYDVVTQQNPTQYSTYKKVLRDAGNRDIVSQRCYDNALAVLNGEVECPDNIVWQANFKQGSGVYEEIHTSYSVSYFCYR